MKSMDSIGVRTGDTYVVCALDYGEDSGYVSNICTPYGWELEIHA